MRRHCSIGMSSAGVALAMPALLTASVRGPSACCVFADRGGDGRAVDDVAGHDQRAAALALDGCSRLLEALARRHVEQRDVGAGLGEADRDALTDPASGPRHEGDFVLQAEQTHFGLLLSATRFVGDDDHATVLILRRPLPQAMGARLPPARRPHPSRRRFAGSSG